MSKLHQYGALAPRAFTSTPLVCKLHAGVRVSALTPAIRHAEVSGKVSLGELGKAGSGDRKYQQRCVARCHTRFGAPKLTVAPSLPRGVVKAGMALGGYTAMPMND